MQSYSHGACLTPLLGDTIGANLAATAARFPDREALVGVEQGVRLTYAGLDAAVTEAAKGMLASGLEIGDRIGIWAQNVVEWVITQYAAARIGAVLVTVNPAYRSHELAYVLQQSGMQMLVAASTIRDTDCAAVIEQVRGEAPDLTEVVLLDTEDWEALLTRGEAVLDSALTERMARLDADQPICIQYTSGTTGFPKGATLSHHNLLNNGFFVGELCDYTEQDRICVPVPFYHCFGMVMGTLAATSHGACVVIPAPWFDPAATLRAVEAERCTSLYGVPTMFIAELGDPAFAAADLSSLRTGIMAGSPCPVEVMKRVVSDMHMPDVTICYGMTETSPVSTQTRAEDDLERRVSTVGRVHPHVEVKVVDPVTGAVVPRGQSGELCTRGYSVMLGYWDDPVRTEQAVDQAGYMHTGDLAVMDAEGYLAITGRIKDMVIRGGENVSPREVEELIYSHPAVADVQVVGVPDARYGEELMAWVKITPGAALDPEELRGWCWERISRQKVPRHVHVMAPGEDWPMTVTGKVQKYLIRERSEQLLATGS